ESERYVFENSTPREILDTLLSDSPHLELMYQESEHLIGVTSKKSWIVRLRDWWNQQMDR
ncbi:MAG: hypothetical protein AAF585_16085, partial [Verrucomicrobiota bacterium]